MEQSIITEHDCNVLGGLFQIIVSDLKGGSSTWEDFALKACKFQNQLKSTISASTAFLDAFQKVADMATTTRGGTKEIGTSLTRLVLRHRSVEAKMKSFSSAIFDCLITPLQDRIEEWKKTTLQLDKEHNKELKRLRQEFKKRQICDSAVSSNSFRHKKQSARMSKNSKYDFLDSLSNKGIYGTIGNVAKSNSSSLSRSLDSETECNERLILFEELEKKAVRRALIEERSHFCLFVKFLEPVVEEEIAMIQEISHIQEIMDSLSKLTTDPFDLPLSSESVISSLKLSKPGSTAWNLQTPPSSPSSLGSRKSSMCSISSYNSSSSSSTYGQTGPNKYFSLTHLATQQMSPATNNYGPSLYSKINSVQPETIYAKNADFTQISLNNETTQSDTVSSNSRFNEPNGEHSSNAFDASDLQFELETDSNDCGYKSASAPVPLNTTNPFLDSYAPETVYQPPSNTQYSSAYPSVGGSSSIYSDGSITPTNPEQANSVFTPTGRNEAKSSKPPPAPPIRRTSSISNPNAITIGTLKSAGISTNYEDMCKNLSLYDEINVLTKSMNDINYTLKYTDFTNSPTSSRFERPATTTPKEEEGSSCTNDKSEYQSVKSLFEHYTPLQSMSRPSEEDAQMPLPAPPPEAFLDLSNDTQAAVSSGSQNHYHHHYNKITNVHREFLESLNSKLSQSPLAHSPNVRVSKRRSSSQSGAEEYDSYSKHRTSARSSSTTRSTQNSRKNSLEKSNIISNFRENFIDKLGNSLLQKQQQQQTTEFAKVLPASNVLQRKQSVPDLNELNSSNLKSQNRVTFSSSLNLASPSQAFQVVEIQTNPTQPIYASRAQLKREIQELYGSLGSTLYGGRY